MVARKNTPMGRADLSNLIATGSSATRAPVAVGDQKLN